MSHVVILGDVHLGKGTSIGRTSVGATINSRVEDQLNLLDWTLETAIEHDAYHIIITGDIFEDPKPHPFLITAFISWLNKCRAHNVYVHIVMGNHDILRSGSVYTSPLDIVLEMDSEYFSVYKSISTIFIGTTGITLMPFRDRKSYGAVSNTEALSLLRDSLIYEANGIPITYNRVLVGHLAIEGSIPIGDEIDDIANELFCPVSMFSDYDHVWMGHVHKPQTMSTINPHVSHIGSMDLSNFGETDHNKKIIILDCNTSRGKYYNFSEESLPTRPLKKISITVPKDTKDSTKYVLSELKKNKSLDRAIVRVEINLASSELTSVNKSDVEKYLIQQGAFNVNGILESKKTNLIKKDTKNTMDTKMDINNAIKTYGDKYVEDKLRPAFIELATEIVNLYKAEVKE